MKKIEKILIAGGDETSADIAETLLNSRGYTTLYANSESAVSMTETHSPDLLLIDTALPDADGYAVLRQIRERSNVPVIAMCATRSEEEMINCLNNGADDFIVKPICNDELLARIQNAARIHKQKQPDSCYRNAGLIIDYEKRLVTVRGKEVHLTPIEYKIVVLFSQNPGKVLTHDYIIQNLWGDYAGDSQLLRVNVANIRRKLETNPANPVYIITEVGVGYRMRENED